MGDEAIDHEGRPASPVERHRPTRRVVLLVAAAVAVVAVTAFVLGRASAPVRVVPRVVSAPTPSSAMVGYWITADTGAIDRCLQIRRTGDSFAVGQDGSYPRPVPAKGAALVLQEGAPSTSTTITPGIVLSYVRGNVLETESGDPAAGGAAAHVFTRSSRQAYLAAALAFDDEQMKQAIETIGNAIKGWAEERNVRFPGPAQIVPTSRWGKWFARKFGGWQYDPYAKGAALIRQGPRRGQFTYRTTGARFVLVAHLAGGRSYTIRSSSLP